MTWIIFGKALLAIGIWFVIVYAIGKLCGKAISWSSRNYAPISRRTHLRNPYRRSRW
jgi:hypothetical protein